MWQVSAQTTDYDHQYWREKGWFSGKYYYETKLNPISNALTALAGKMIEFFMKKVFKDVKFSE
jgi:hypothetical protein